LDGRTEPPYHGARTKNAQLIMNTVLTSNGYPRRHVATGELSAIRVKMGNALSQHLSCWQHLWSGFEQRPFQNGSSLGWRMNTWP